jgi:hypothetical protein
MTNMNPTNHNPSRSFDALTFSAQDFFNVPQNLSIGDLCAQVDEFLKSDTSASAAKQDAHTSQKHSRHGKSLPDEGVVA